MFWAGELHAGLMQVQFIFLKGGSNKGSRYLPPRTRARGD